MSSKKLNDIIGNSDIYLIDQIAKERYGSTDNILDAGTGGGRNLYWFYNNDYPVWGIDKNAEYIDYAKQVYPDRADNFIHCEISNTPFSDNYFDHIICSAVLHFANNALHFKKMFAELIRILKPEGSLLIRMASNIGIQEHVRYIENGIYELGDGSERFLLTKNLLQEVMSTHQLSFLEPLKSTNVNDLRCMSTLVIQKNKD